MSFVPVKARVLQAINVAALNPKENTLDEVILKNYEAHKDGSPATVLNLSKAVVDRLRELQPPAVSTETLAPVVPPVVPATAPVVETVASVTATNAGPIAEPGGPTINPELTATSSESSSSEVSPAPQPEAKTEEKTDEKAQKAKK